MAEYIERETFLKDIEERYCLPCKEAGRDHNGCKCRSCWVDDMCGEVIDATAADVAPVRHGRWEFNDNESKKHSEPVYYCSDCKNWEAWGNTELTNYCPYCGAKMDLEASE